MTEIRLRRLGPSDAAAFREIRLEALRTEPENYASTHEDWAPRPVSAFASLLETVRYVAAETGGGFQGITGWYPGAQATTRHRGTVVAVFVRPMWRRHGLFRRMMEAVIADARGQVRQLELQVSAENAAACAAYRAMGFEEIGRVPDALNHGGRFSDELVMCRRLEA